MIKVNRSLLCMSVLVFLASMAFQCWNFGYRSGVPIATRYHLRERTTNFYERSKTSCDTKDSAPGKAADRTKSQKALENKRDDKGRLATRYHQRDRTTSFFQRAIG